MRCRLEVEDLGMGIRPSIGSFKYQRVVHIVIKKKIKGMINCNATVR